MRRHVHVFCRVGNTPCFEDGIVESIGSHNAWESLRCEDQCEIFEGATSIVAATIIVGKYTKFSFSFLLANVEANCFVNKVGVRF